MTTIGFIARNALRNKRRFILSVSSVAMSLFLLVTLQVALRELTNPINDEGSTLRIIVRNKVSLAQPLPARQLATIERIPGVAAVTPFSYFGGLYKGDEKFTSFAQFAVDPVRANELLSDAKVPAEQMKAWVADRTSAVVGKMTAERYKLKIGDRMQFTGQIYPCDLEFKIAGIYEGTADDRNVFFHHKYLDESLGNPGTVGTWWVKAASAEEATLITDRINKAFANTSAEVRAETERAFQLGFVSMWANIKILIGGISVVVVFALLLVTVSTMSMAIRERFRELAVLKALGFRRRELFAFILAESFGLATLGAVFGAGGAWCLYRVLDMQTLSSGMFVMFEVTPQMMALAFSIAAVLGLLSAAAPMIGVARTSVVQGLKTLD
ncbi:MAG: ABC transporter permease [Verrucomicrobia bacterium]|nr:ABC transporter permease [Verrucomicrobiota bacterium]